MPSFSLQSSDAPTSILSELETVLREGSTFFRGTVKGDCFVLSSKVLVLPRMRGGAPIAATGDVSASSAGGSVIHVRTRPAIITIVVFLIVGAIFVMGAMSASGPGTWSVWAIVLGVFWSFYYVVATEIDAFRSELSLILKATSFDDRARP